MGDGIGRTEYTASDVDLPQPPRPKDDQRVLAGTASFTVQDYPRPAYRDITPFLFYRLGSYFNRVTQPARTPRREPDDNSMARMDFVRNRRSLGSVRPVRTVDLTRGRIHFQPDHSVQERSHPHVRIRRRSHSSGGVLCILKEREDQNGHKNQAQPRTPYHPRHQDQRQSRGDRRGHLRGGEAA